MTAEEVTGCTIVACVMLAWFAFLGWLCVLLAGPWFGAGIFGGALFTAGLAVGAVMSNGDRTMSSYPVHADPDDVGRGGIEAGWYER